MTHLVPVLRPVLGSPFRRSGLYRIAGMMPTLDLWFANSKSLVDAISGQNLITYSRASTGTYVDGGGLVKTATTNEARFTHDPATGASLGLLVEEQRTNLLLWSRDLTQSAWAKTNITPALNQVGADGTANAASSITATAANGTVLQAVTSASAARATTAYVKRLSGSGTIQMTQDGGTTWTAITVTSNWVRVDIPSATVTNPSMGFRIVTSGDSIAVDYTQCETGSFVTSAIPTTTAAVTRSADVVSISGSNFSSWYNQSAMTFFHEAIRQVSTQFPSRLLISDGTNNNLINAYLDAAGNSSSFEIKTGGTSQVAIFGGGGNLNQPDAAVFAYSLNDVAIYYRSSGGGIDTSATMPTVDRMIIGNGWTGPISRIVAWSQRLSNSTLQAIRA